MGNPKRSVSLNGKTHRAVKKLDFLLKGDWFNQFALREKSIQNLKEIVRLGNEGLDPKEVQKKVGMSTATFKSVVCELRKANKAGYDVETYLAAGRPLRAGAKVLVEEKAGVGSKKK